MADKKYSKYSYLLEYVKINFLTAIEYKTSFFLQVFGMILNDIALLFFWWALFKNIGTIKGWSLNDVITIYAVVATGFGFATGIFGNVFRIPYLILRGELDYYLTLPKTPLMHILISKMSFSAWGDVAFGILIYILIVRGTVGQVVLFILLSIASSLIFVSFSIIISSIAFYYENAQVIFDEIINSVITFSLYPSSIFADPIKIILYTLIPAGLVGYIPAYILKNFSFKNLAILIGAVILFMIIGLILFNRGLRKYTSLSSPGQRI
jgi:ABC-2 type transport system permease protein